MKIGLLLACAATALLSACSTPAQTALSCFEGAVRIDQNGPSHPASPCIRISDREFELSITPESQPINPSPWYAFGIQAEAPAQVSIVLDYGEARHRYAPWISQHDEAWRRLAPSQIVVSDDGALARLNLDAPAGRTQVAAQPIYSASAYEALETRWGGDWRDFGTSQEGRALRARITTPGHEDAGWILILGRQHPPEIPGAWALEGFVDALIRARTDGAIQTGLIIAPLLNPDGVAAGHWRLNAAQTDLNRDWTERNQPEIQAVYALLDALGVGADDLRLMVDFHATVADRIYLPQADELPARANDRLEAWLAAMDAQGLYTLIEPRRTNPARRVSAKAAFTDGWGTVAVTWEAGDETPEETVRQIAEGGAEAWIACCAAADAWRP
jgi:predicted deacylase